MKYLSTEGQKRFKALLEKDYQKAISENRVIEHYACTGSEMPDEIGWFHPIESLATEDFTESAYSGCASGVLTVTYGISEAVENPCVLLMYNRKGGLVFELFELTTGLLILFFEGLERWSRVYYKPVSEALPE